MSGQDLGQSEVSTSVVRRFVLGPREEGERSTVRIRSEGMGIGSVVAEGRPNVVVGRLTRGPRVGRRYIR